MLLDLLPLNSLCAVLGALIGSSSGPEGAAIGGGAGFAAGTVFNVGIDLLAALIGWEQRVNSPRYMISYTIGIIGSGMTYIPAVGNLIGTPLELIGYIGTKDDVFY